jgi:hypothetical protein
MRAEFRPCEQWGFCYLKGGVLSLKSAVFLLPKCLFAGGRFS